MLLITGANGLVGSEICKYLSEKEIPFYALKRPNSDLSLLSDITINWIVGDILDTVGISGIFESHKITHVIHCAAVVSYHKQDKELMHTVNVKGTKNMVDICIEYNAQQFIHISSIAALGRETGKSTIHEDNKWVDSPLNSVYAQTKYLAELEVWRGHNEGVNACVVNPSVVIAAGDGVRSSSKLLKYVWDEKKFYTNGKLNYLDIRDLTKVIEIIYSKKVSGERYILNAGNIEYQSIFNQIANNFGKKPPRIKLGAKMLKILYFIDQIKYLVTRIRPIVTSEMLKSTKTDFLYANDKSREFFKLEYTPLAETLEWACNSFKQHKKA